MASSPKLERAVKVNKEPSIRGRSITRNSTLKRSDSLESIRSTRSVARSRALFEDIADRESVISGRVNINRRAVQQGISHWKQALNTEWNDDRIENARKMGELEERIKQVNAQLSASNKVLAQVYGNK